jgi:hypothetical protein
MPTHGKESTYTNWGCRCDRCRKTHRETAFRQRRKRARKLLLMKKYGVSA